MRSAAASTCPQCEAEGVPLVFGKPGPELAAAADAGLVRLAGCFMPDDAPNWSCPQGHTWLDTRDPRGRDVRLTNALIAFGYTDVLDDDDLDDEAEERSARWQAAGVTWKVVRWTAGDRSATSIELAAVGALGRLTLWPGGEAEMEWTGPGENPTDMRHEHVGLTSRVALCACLDELETRLGLPT